MLIYHERVRQEHLCRQCEKCFQIISSKIFGYNDYTSYKSDTNSTSTLSIKLCSSLLNKILNLTTNYDDNHDHHHNAATG